MNTALVNNGWQNNGTISQSDYDKELANIANQATILANMGIPQTYTDNYAKTAAQMALNASSPYYTAGLSTQPMVKKDDGSMEAFTNELHSYGIGPGTPPIGIDARDTIKSISAWTVPRIAIVIIGVIVVGAGIFSLTGKDAVEIISNNPEILAGV